MSKAPAKTRKKRPNCKLVKNVQQDLDEEQAKIQTPQMRIFEANRILCGQLLPSKFKFREKQVAEIESTIKMLTSSKKPQVCKIIMVTGSPGAGKTMSTNHVLQKLEKEDYLVISLNSNLLKRKHDVQTILAQQLLKIEDADDKNLTTFKVISELQKEKSKIRKCVLYVEEIELFFSSHKQILTQDFFDIFTNKNLKIVLLGISNTIDALQKYCQKIKIKSTEVANIVFNPYTVEQLKEIIIDRLDQVNKFTGIKIVFEEKLVRFVANKINQIKKGDMRMVFQFLKTLSHNLFSAKDKEEELPEEIVVTIELVNKSFTNTKGIKTRMIGDMPSQTQIVLIAMYNFLKQNDQISITLEQLRKKVNQMNSILGLQPRSSNQKQLQYLSDYGLVSERPKKEHNSQPVTRYLLKISMAEVKNFFEGHELLGKLV